MKWRKNKIPFESAEYDLIHCRDWHAGSMLDKLRLLDRLEREYKERQEMEHYMQLLDKNMLPFVTTGTTTRLCSVGLIVGRLPALLGRPTQRRAKRLLRSSLVGRSKYLATACRLVSYHL